MNTDDMAQRGADDAEHGDEPNPFYYQHYYHYRRSYNRARQRQKPVYRRAVLWLIGVVGVAAIALFALNNQQLVTRPPAAAASAKAPTIRSTTTPQPLFPTPTATPEPNAAPEQPIGLQVNAFALITNTAGKALRGRAQPNLTAKVLTTFNEGERVRLLEGPVEADGLRWWRIESDRGNGWSAEYSPKGDVWLTPTS